MLIQLESGDILNLNNVMLAKDPRTGRSRMYPPNGPAILVDCTEDDWKRLVQAVNAKIVTFVGEQAEQVKQIALTSVDPPPDITAIKIEDLRDQLASLTKERIDKRWCRRTLLARIEELKGKEA